MDEYEKWGTLMFSIRRAAKILNIDLTEADMPDYLNWRVASALHEKLWSLIYLRKEINEL